MSNKKYYIGPSKIHGKGVIANKFIPSAEIIDIAIHHHFYLYPEITSNFGSMINHSYQANSYLHKEKDKYYVVASRPIRRHEEITVNYHHTPWFISKPDPAWK